MDFLHPAQRQCVEREYRGPARVAGTGKTIVALHRAVHLARRHPESRVLLATFSDALAAALRTRLRPFIGHEPKIAERLEVHSMSGIGRRLYVANVGRLHPATGRPVPPARAGRRRRQRGAARINGLGVQRTRTRGEDVRFARGRDGGHCGFIAAWLRARKREAYAPQAIGVFVSSSEQIKRALSAVQAAGVRPVQLDGGSDGVAGAVAVGTMHLAKGLEFRAVAAAACDEDVIPLQARTERVGDDADLEEAYGTERHLLYVARTRVRDRLPTLARSPSTTCGRERDRARRPAERAGEARCSACRRTGRELRHRLLAAIVIKS